MLVATRRGPASIARCLRFSSTSLSSNLARSWRTSYLITPLSSVSFFRAFNTSSAWRQEAAVRGVKTQQDGDVDKESVEKPPQTQAQYGPVTKFVELAERNMVTKTIVTTIVRDLKLETMTHVQSLTINETLKGIDVYDSDQPPPLDAKN